MNRIRLLSEQVANQIAAGEVIERPASVVKELVENALDAGATRLTVEVQEGGKSLIRISDNGCGMNRDDALMSLERHATSKIQTAHDLQRITTMGFRGEALPSIASVSRFVMTTRESEPEAVEGTQIVVHGGRIMEVKSAGCPTGTTMEVRQLFYNLPARRKFLRSESTERAHIQHYFTLVSLAYPGVSLTYLQDQRMVWQLPALAEGDQTASRIRNVQERLRLLQGANEPMLPVDFQGLLPRETGSDGEDTVVPAFHVWGILGAPGVSRATRETQFLFVNKRPVENRGLNHALLEGCHTTLMKGRFPVCCLFIEISPAEVDINIHPAKREVKFHQERAVRQRVTQAVRQALLRHHPLTPGGEPTKTPSEQAADVETAGHTQVDLGLAGPAATDRSRFSTAVPQVARPPGTADERARVADELRSQSMPMVRPFVPPPQASTPVSVIIPDPPSTGSGAGKPIVESNTSAALGTERTEPSTTSATEPPAAELITSAQPVSASPYSLWNVPLRVLGVLGNLYVLMESDRGLVLMDQHAAHERILFEQMMQQMEVQEAPSQRLLLAETIELPPREAAFVREQLATLSRLGVGLSEFGERTFLLDALPPYVQASSPRQFVMDVIDDLRASGSEVNTLRLGEHVVAKTVCRHAVKAHDPLSLQELEKLLQNLRQCAMPFTCPHGRPTLIEISYRELEKKFGRIV